MQIYKDILIGPHQLSLDITNKCNLRCLHCFNSSGENAVINEELSDEEVLEFVTSVSKLEPYNLCFCGGETLLRKDLICRCIKILKENGSHCSLVSNSILATKETLQELESAGLDVIQFSLDGLSCSHDRIRNKNGVYKHVIDAIKYTLNDTKMHLGIAFTPTSFNIDDFKKVYIMLDELFASSNRAGGKDTIELRSQPLMIIGRAKNNLDLIPSADQYRYLVNEMKILELNYHSKYLDVRWGDPIDHLIRYKDKDMVMDQATIHANGDIVADVYLPLVVGNIKKHSLSEYWNGGLNTIWSSNIMQFLVSNMQSIKDLEKISYLIADLNMGNDIQLDILENDFNDLNLISDLILKMA